MKLKTFVALNVSSIMLICFSAPAGIAVPYDERAAWCADKSYRISSSNYDNTKRFNECMKTAAQQIRKYEKQQEIWREERKRELIEWEKKTVSLG